MASRYLQEGHLGISTEAAANKRQLLGEVPIILVLDLLYYKWLSLISLLRPKVLTIHQIIRNVLLLLLFIDCDQPTTLIGLKSDKFNTMIV